jgi:hypothetical protein
MEQIIAKIVILLAAFVIVLCNVLKGKKGGN